MNTATGTPAHTATTDTSTAIEVRGVDKSFGATTVLRDVSVTVPAGAIVALLGPSGCGKTTLLRSIAGLERIDSGQILIGDRVVSAPSAYVLPEKRRVGMVFQDWALFPHLTVAQNVAYGLPRAERKGHRVAEVLELVDLPELGDRLPATLSGGQQQRVALARALAPRPRVLLLDEPFSNLDTALRVQVRSEVHQLLAELGVTTIFVTHDQEEAFVLGDEVAVLHEGRLVQQAAPAELYARPASPWVAGFVGDANLVPGQADGDCARTPVGLVPLEEPAGGAVQVLLRPEELRLEPVNGPNGANGSNGSNGSNGEHPPAATVELREFYGHDTVYLVRPEGAAIVRVRAGSVPRFGRGDRVEIRYVGPPAVAFASASSDA